MKEIGLYEAKTTLSALVKELTETGKAIALTKHGEVVAHLCPPPRSHAPKAGMLKSPGFAMAEDFDDCEVGFEDLYADPADLKVAESKPSYPKPMGS